MYYAKRDFATPMTKGLQKETPPSIICREHSELDDCFMCGADKVHIMIKEFHTSGFFNTTCTMCQASIGGWGYSQAIQLWNMVSKAVKDACDNPS
jgi:hypothetical protein